MTLVEKILAAHAGLTTLKPGEVINITIDTRVARDFGGANVIKDIAGHGLTIENPGKTFFTFDCNPAGSDQEYAANQHACRFFARENNIRVYDIDSGIGTHLLIEEGLVYPGATAVSTDSHANILGAIGAFGQGMGNIDIASVWSKGTAWFKVPPSALIQIDGEIPAGITPKDIVLNLLNTFGASTLLGYSVEIHGPAVDKLSLDGRITISSMATEMGVIIILFPPSDDIIRYCSARSKVQFYPLFPDNDAFYHKRFNVDASGFSRMVSKPGKPHETVKAESVVGQKIDSAFIGSCTNGRMEDMQAAANILKERKVAPGVVLKIVPSTDRVWNACLGNGTLDIFKKAGAMVSNAGCAGCAAGQVGQNGPGEVTISTGNRNFPGKQGNGDVFLASPEIVAASAVAGYITLPEKIPDYPALFQNIKKEPGTLREHGVTRVKKSRESLIIKGRTWVIPVDNIDTDMIYHNRYLSVTETGEMGQFTFKNLRGFEEFPLKARQGDFIVAGKNFGCGSSRQQAVNCFLALGIGCIMAESFGSIYERNAINAALPVVTCKCPGKLQPKDGDYLEINLETGTARNLNNGMTTSVEPFSDVQLNIFLNGGLL
jgi:3-isopropylmalate dehydratase small subunit